MSYVMSHNVFARRGDDWAHRARIEQKPTGLIVREVRGPNWHELDHRWTIDGFGPDGEPEKAPERRRLPREVRAAAPLCRPRGGRRSEFPKGFDHYHAPEEIKGKATPLTPEQEQLRKKQRAQVKARLTKAARRLERERQEVLSIILGL